MILAALALTIGRELTVGPGRQFPRIENAIRSAKAGDTILVYPVSGGYRRVAVRVLTPHLTIVGAGEHPVELRGDGFDYSGSGVTPRAIIQVEPTGLGATIRNFKISGAHNQSHNGAGVRIDGASGVSIEACDLWHNDMGVMSNGSAGSSAGAAGQVIEDSHIHHNGDVTDPGYSHNLYLAGADATLRHCEIDHSLAGHDLKSRAHFTLIEDCYVHDAADREFDFVDSVETAAANSNAAIVNTVIAKVKELHGNHEVIHFGQETGIRQGRLWVIHCTIQTSFAAAVLVLNGAGVHAELDDNIVVNELQSKPRLVTVSDGANGASVVGGNNWISSVYRLTGTEIDSRSRYAGVAPAIRPPNFVATRLPDIGIPAPSYYQDGAGREWEVTPAAVLGARWRPLKTGL